LQLKNHFIKKTVRATTMCQLRIYRKKTPDQLHELPVRMTDECLTRTPAPWQTWTVDTRHRHHQSTFM